MKMISFISSSLLLVFIITTTVVTVTAQGSSNTEVSLGNFTETLKNVSGEVIIQSAKVLEIRGFTYDGSAPTLFFWADTNSIPSIDGFRLLDTAPTNSCGTIHLEAAYGNVSYIVEFPDNMTIFDVLGGSIAAWCETAQSSFGHVVVPTTLDNIPTTGSGPDLVCSNDTTTEVTDIPIATPTTTSPVTVTEPISAPVPVSSPTTISSPTTTPVTSSTSTGGISLGNFTMKAHQLAGEVIVLSERVLEIRNFVYDGTAPAVYFWADTYPIPSTNGFPLRDGSPSNGCGIVPLSKAADGTQTYRVEFPPDTAIYKILGGSISVWCEEFVTSFGEVVIPSVLPDLPLTSSGPALECPDNVEAPTASPVDVTGGNTPTSSSGNSNSTTPTMAKAPASSPTTSDGISFHHVPMSLLQLLILLFVSSSIL